MGPSGMHETAELCLQKANYALDQLTAGGKLSRVFNRPIFKEFVVRVSGRSVEDLLEAANKQYILPGVPLGRWYPHLSDCLLVAVTEKRTKEEIDRLVKIIG